MRTTFPRQFALAAAALGAAVALTSVAAVMAQAPAQPPPTPAGQPTFKAGINFVRVDVIVTDNKGNPVADLKPTDFELFEDNKPQTVETFRLVKVDTTTVPTYSQRGIRTRNDEEAAAADENARIFVFFLDDYHVRRDNSMRMRKPVMDFIANQLSPNDLIGVMYPLTPLDAVVLTRNHQGVLNTVEKFEGRKFDYEPRNDVEMSYVYRFPAETVERIRRQVSLTALRGLSHKLGSLREGRKSVILLSEGYVAVLPPQLRDQIAAMPGSGNNPARRNPFAGDENPMEERVNFSASIDLNQELQDVFDAANRNNTSIYALDPRGLAVGDFDITANISIQSSQRALGNTMDTLRVLAENTDGRAIVNRNDFAEAMKQIIRDSSAYYLIGYNSTQAPTDGKFHEIKVRVKGRSGLQVRARRGYWAYTDADVKKATATNAASGPPPAVTKALAAIAPMTNRRYIRTWIGTGPGADGKTKVTFLWEPLPATPGAKRDEPRRVSVLATSPSGDIVYRGRVPADLAAVGAGATVSFDAAPGKLGIRLTIEGDGTGTLDQEDRDLVVPDLSAPEVMLGTPRVWFARNAREFTALTTGAEVPPSAARDFRRTDRLVVRVDAFAPGTIVPVVAARLLNQQGTKMIDVTVTPPASPGQSYALDLPLSSFAAGQYLLELSATADGHKPVTELVAFRIGS
jgi:VWFA-related protein